VEKFELFAARDEFAVRYYNEEEHPFRTKFERDRDRILYSKAFRRLSGKTQVFVVGDNDHLRTRLTHTLEVSQIARTISRYFGFNEILTEAIALGHDLGHTPFGHVGERTLNYIMNGCYNIKDFNKFNNDKYKGFKHNWQSIRVVQDFEQINKDYKGLNLTNFTLWGILNHSKKNYDGCKKRSKENKCNLLLNNIECKTNLSIGFYEENYGKFFKKEDSWTFEGLIVAIADEIAQRHHDIEDGIEAKIIDKDEIIYKFKKCFKDCLDNKYNVKLKRYENKYKKLIKDIEKEKDKLYYLPKLSRLIVDFLVTTLIIDSEEKLDQIKKEFNLKSYKEFYTLKHQIYKTKDIYNIINYSNEFQVKEDEFSDFLKDRILKSYKTQSMDGKADFIIRQLFKAYVTNPQQLPDRTILNLYRNLADELLLWLPGIVGHYRFPKVKS